jgi:sensor domain CHASE-containing protein
MKRAAPDEPRSAHDRAAPSAGMSLRIKIALIITLVVALYTAVDYATQRVLIRPSFGALEEREARKDLARVQQALLAEIDTLDARCTDWAAWNETYDFVRHSRAPADEGDAREIERYVAANLGPMTFASGHINLLYIVDRDGKVLWGKIRDLESDRELALKELSYQQLAPSNPMLCRLESGQDDERDVPAGIRGLKVTELGPMFIAARPILTSERGLPWVGTLIMGRLLSDTLVRRIADRTEVAFSVWPLEGGALPAADRAVLDDVTSAPDFVIAPRDDRTLAVYATLGDMRRIPALLVRADIPRDISAKGATATKYALISNLAAGLLLVLVLLGVLRRMVLAPISRLTRHALAIGRTDDMSAKTRIERNDEIGTLSREFDRMMEKLEHSRAQFGQAARTAGMSEIATGILHNVGNVLNSVNVSAGVVAQQVQSSKLAKLERLVEMVEAQGAGLGEFIASHPKGKHIAPYLGEVARLMRAEHDTIDSELRTLSEGIEHIRRLVDAQQALAGQSQLAEAVSIEEQIELAIALSGMRERGHSVALESALDSLGRVRLDRHKLAQILVNLLKNAADSIEERGTNSAIRVRLKRVDGERLSIEVEDDGVGIRPENMSKIFHHGFTTKPDGHGFGLHTAANAATEMGAHLNARSAGPDRGATFVLELPLELAPSV